MGDRQRVAERDQVGGFFRGHDAGQARCRQHVALGRLAALDRVERGLGQADLAAGHRLALLLRLGRDIDHPGLTFVVNVGQFTHGLHLA